MKSHTSRQSLLAYWADLIVQLQRDADQTEVAVHRRDRALVSGLEETAGDRRRLVMGWLDALRDAGHAFPGHAIGTAYRLQILVLVLMGFAVGWGVAAAVFAYDGSQPVNVVHVLAVFIGFQLLLLVLLGVVALPHRVTRFIPGATAVQEALSWLSPGQVTRLLARRLPRPVREILQGTGSLSVVRGKVFRRVPAWAALFASQAFAVAFNVGALAGAVYLVTFSDLAFAWSTTLEPDPERVHRITGLLSVPWAKAFPNAVPSLELIEDTLYYRQQGVVTTGETVRWGEWWPFLVSCLVTYGFLPRLLLLAFSGWNLNRSLLKVFTEAPAVTAIVDRLKSQLVTTQAPSPEPSPASAATSSSGGSAPQTESDRLVELPGFHLVNWGGLELDDRQLRQQAERSWGRDVVGVHSAGGRASIEEDAETITALASTSAATGLLLVVKAWEPPVMELLDFIGDLRAAVGESRLMVVAPIGLDAEGRLTASKPVELEQWDRRLKTLGDPALVTRAWPGGGQG